MPNTQGSFYVIVRQEVLHSFTSSIALMDKSRIPDSMRCFSEPTKAPFSLFPFAFLLESECSAAIDGRSALQLHHFVDENAAAQLGKKSPRRSESSLWKEPRPTLRFSDFALFYLPSTPSLSHHSAPVFKLAQCFFL